MTVEKHSKLLLIHYDSLPLTLDTRIRGHSILELWVARQVTCGSRTTALFYP